MKKLNAFLSLQDWQTLEADCSTTYHNSNSRSLYTGSCKLF